MRPRKHGIQGSPPAERHRIISRLCGALIPTGILAPLAFLCGCSGIVTGQNAQATPPQTYSISGTISPVASGSGATVTLSGAATATTTADGAGNYTFAGLANGTYAVTPRRTGYTFSPSIQATTVSGANVTGLNFTAQTNPTFSISGTISPTTGGSGATVTLNGAAAGTTTADGAGSYVFAGLGNGNYTVTPTNTGFAFAPTNQSVTVSGVNVSGVNFTASPQVAHSVALTWIASITSTVTGYNVYRSLVSGTSYVKINSSIVLAPLVSYTDTTPSSGTTYYYVTTAVDATGSESAFSNEVSAVIP
jgi:hypothetical protein